MQLNSYKNLTCSYILGRERSKRMGYIKNIFIISLRLGYEKLAAFALYASRLGFRPRRFCAPLAFYNQALFSCLEQVRQQGEYKSLHRGLNIGFGTWEFDPTEIENPFPENEGYMAG
ncbi:hypothetical protein HanPI659440_Chr01g0032261 [Helianthus annuus]|nr:hypothetical protein HanPI659440_Chr01g0032261 [Helianthus annuus]